MRIWYPNGRYCTLGNINKQFDEHSDWFIDKWEQAEAKAPQYPKKTLFEKCELVVSLILFTGIIVAHFLGYVTLCFTLPGSILSALLGVTTYTAWYFLTLRWRNDTFKNINKASKAREEYFSNFFDLLHT